MLNFKIKAAHILIANKQLVDWLLSLNTRNRKVKKSVVASLLDVLVKNKFLLTNQGVGVSTDGVLIDGQHRLIAIAEANYPPVEILVITGLDPKAQSCVDIHAKRSATDVIKLILDRSVGNLAVAAVNFIKKLKISDSGFYMASKTPHLDEVAEYLDENSNYLDEILRALGGHSKAAVVAALHEYAQNYSLDAAKHLAHQIHVGEMLAQHDPAFRLRLYLSKHTSGGGAMQLETYQHTVSACIAHARNEKLQLLRQSTSWDRLPKIAPKRDQENFLIGLIRGKKDYLRPNSGASEHSAQRA